jgi:PTS system ascorbate-specific IIC component
MAVTMPILFFIIGLVAGPSVVAKASGNQNWVIWLIMQGLQFAAGIGVIMMGVRMFLASIIPAFKGISDRLIPGARPALDCPVFYPYSPIGAVIGFLSALGGSIVVTLLLIAMGSPVIIFPGPIPFFFDGCTAGVFGNKFGGWKGAVAAGALTGGLLTHMGAVPLYLMSGPLIGSGVVFSNTDTSTLLPLLFTVIKRGPGPVLGAPFFIMAAVMALIFVLGVSTARRQAGKPSVSAR